MVSSDDAAEILAKTSAVLASSLYREEILRLLAAIPVPKLACWCLVDVVSEDGWIDRVAVAHADPDAAPIAHALQRRFAPRADVPYGVSLAVAALKAQRVPVVDDAILRAVARDEAHLTTLRALRMKSFVSAPLIVSGRPFGVLSLASTLHSYTEEDLALVEELASRASNVLEKATLYADAQSLVRQLENIQLVTFELSRAMDERQVMATAVRRGAEAVGADACVVWMLESDGSLRLADGHGVPELAAGGWHRLEPRDDLPAFRVIEALEPLWVETDEDYRRLAPEVYAAQKAAGRLRAFAALPLCVEGRAVGVLVFSFSLGRRFAPNERRSILTLARQCEQALHRVRLFAREAALRAEAEEAQARAETANRTKDEFLAMLGHELRNPLAPIVTALGILRLRQTERPRELQVIERQVGHLTRLVDDLLDVSRIARGKIDLRLEQVSLAAVVDKALEMVSPLLEQRHHQVKAQVEPGLHTQGDPLRLAQVVANLLSNAARYTNPGGRIEVEAVSEREEVVLRVRDNGVGIEPALLPRVFERFVQGRRELDRSQGGLGLGLAIVENLVKMHDGTVTAASEGPGRGSVFEVRLPRQGTGEPRSTPPAVKAAAGVARAKRVLVVDDNEDAAITVAELLQTSGHEVTVAHDGVAALACVAQFQPDVAILDIGLPVMDGYELGERLRRSFPMRLAALTGYGTTEDHARSEKAGFHAHFVKPVAPDLLLKFVDEAELLVRER